MYYLDAACQIQVDACAGGMHNVHLMSEQAAKTASTQFKREAVRRSTRTGRRYCGCWTEEILTRTRAPSASPRREGEDGVEHRVRQPWSSIQP